MASSDFYCACGKCAFEELPSGNLTVTGTPPCGKNEVFKKEVVVTSPEGGQKFDGDKVRYDLLPRSLLRGVAFVMTHGAKKYAPYNWQKVELHRYLSASDRHLNAVLVDGETTDKDSGYPHAWHYLTNAVFIAWLLVNRPDQVAEYRAEQNGEVV